MERGTLIAGKYELVERLGRGGMGEVWAARDQDLRRDVAVKFLPHDEEASRELLHRFEREAVAAAQINHPNVVTLYERGSHDDLRFLVMELVRGTPLTERVREGTPMPLAEALRIGQEICAALVAAHRAKVVHYDVKPSNVVLATDGRVKVVDFGIAGFTHTRTAFTVAPTSALSPAGTLEYGAPEQFLDSRGDERSDLYALGSVLFALLAGRPPFTGANGYIVLRRKIDEEAPSLAEYRADAPAPVARLVAELLDRDPARRPGAAEAVHARLVALSARATEPVGKAIPEETPPTSSVDQPTTRALPADGPPEVTVPADGRPADVPPTARLPRALRYRTIAVLGALGLFAVIAAINAGFQVNVADSMEWGNGRYEAAERPFADVLPGWREETTPWLMLQAFSGLFLVLFWLAWFSRVREIAGHLSPGRLRHSPTMAMACWFIPVRNLFLPKQITDDIWRAALPEGSAPRLGRARLPLVWWVLWLAMFLTLPIFCIPWTETLSTGTDAWENGVGYGWYAFEPLTWAILVVRLLAIPTAGVTAWFVYRLTAMQAAALGQRPPAA